MFLNKFLLSRCHSIACDQEKTTTANFVFNSLNECAWFIFRAGQSCSFAFSVFIVLAISKHVGVVNLPRYDLILLILIMVQVLLIFLKQETLKELKVICIFHILGFILEFFKTQPQIGSWYYPEYAYSKIMGVPLYSGFMYSAVASFLLQIWRRCQLFVENEPPFLKSLLVAGAIYVNFFSHHFVMDFRWVLLGILVLVFWQTKIYFTPYRHTFRLSFSLCLFIGGLLLWTAENIATYLSAWSYPNQMSTWHVVHWGKIVSWSLLMVVTFVIVARFKRNNQA